MRTDLFAMTANVNVNARLVVVGNVAGLAVRDTRPSEPMQHLPMQHWIFRILGSLCSGWIGSKRRVSSYPLSRSAWCS